MKLELDISVPDAILDEATKERVRHDALEAAVLRLFDERRIRAVEGAHELGLTRIDFMELCRKRGIPLYDYTIENYQDDIASVDKLWPEIGKNVRETGDGGIK